MQEQFDKAVERVYQSWKAGRHDAGPESHPDEESLVCFLEGSLDSVEHEAVERHLVVCARCAEGFALQVRTRQAKEIAVPLALLERAKNAGVPAEQLEILLKAKDTIFELLSTTADVLLGQEVVPAPVLRSRNIKDFKDEISIFKDFQAFRAEIRVINKGGGAFAVQICVKEKQTSGVLSDARISLLRDHVELESYHAESGSVTFEHLLAGSYVIGLAAPDGRQAYVILAIAV